MSAPCTAQHSSKSLSLIVASVLLIVSVSAFSQAGNSTFDEARVAILWERGVTGSSANDQASFASAFRSLNIQVDTLLPGKFDRLVEYNLLVVPNNVAQKRLNSDAIRKFVEEGGNLIIDGRSTLAASFGFTYQDSSISVSRLLDGHEDTLHLAESDKLPMLAGNEDQEVFCREALTGTPIVVGRRYAKGRILDLGILFDPISSGGYSRFPFLLEYVWNWFSLRPILKREYLEMYFDPGLRHNEDVDSLALAWKSNGIQVIHAAAWHQHATWSYNYTRLVQACHEQGMRIYAWLEPPHVSEKFWRQYPAWKEVNYRGETILPQWRYLEALTDSDCLEKVISGTVSFLNAYEWDGVNLAELYFESDRGPRNPSLYSPMHISARNEFKVGNGFDPAQLFDAQSKYFWKSNHKALNKFERYRAEKIRRLHEEFLRAFDDVRKEKGRLDVVVTAFDDISNPKLHSYLGTDIRSLIKLQKKYTFILQIEDPQSRWSGDPRRYAVMGERYRSLIGIHKNFTIDLNILQGRDMRQKNMFPTNIQTGIECYHMVNSAAKSSDAVTIYSESTVRPDDLRMLCYAASAPATVRRVKDGWYVKSPFPVILELPEQYAFLKMSTGEELTSDHGRFSLPEGEYTLLKTK